MLGWERRGMREGDRLLMLRCLCMVLGEFGGAHEKG